MSEPLVLAAIVGGLVSVAPIVWLPCYLAGHLDDIAAGWADGLVWLTARQATARRIAVPVAAEVVSFGLWVREDILAGPGHHRAGVLA